MHPLAPPSHDRRSWPSLAAPPTDPAQLRSSAAVGIQSLEARRAATIVLATFTWLTIAVAAVACAAQPPASPRPRAGQAATGNPQPAAQPGQAVKPGPAAGKARQGAASSGQAAGANPGQAAGVRPGQPTAVRPAAPPTAASRTAGRNSAAKTPEKPAMRPVELITKDHVKLRAFYFPSDKGKEAVPVIVMHEWQGQAGPYSPMVQALRDAGCAVIVPEFRGHGGSREQEFAGRTREFDVNRMGKADVLNMITGDLEAVKKFLVEENNAQKLNLNALTLIGIREGAILAAHWAVRDLNFPSVGSVKQGQDVKALVLISPERMLKGFTLDETLTNRALWQLPFLIVVGQSSSQASDTERFYRRLETMKKRAGRGVATGLQYEQIATSLDGHALVNDAPGVIEKVKAFVVSEMVSKSSQFPWIERQ